MNQPLRNNLDNNPYLTVIVPAYQEAMILRDSINQLYFILECLDMKYEVIIADDGSTDGTQGIVTEIEREKTNLRSVRYPKNRGRGFILSAAIKESRGNIICYIDADMQVDPEVILRFVQYLDNGYDIVIGSKHHPKSQIIYSNWRKILSNTYSMVTRNLFSIDIKDFQCGAKAFNKAAISRLLSQLTSHGWSWDTELIIKAHRVGYRILEIPVVVRPRLNRKSRSVFDQCLL